MHSNASQVHTKTRIQAARLLVVAKDCPLPLYLARNTQQGIILLPVK